MVKDEIEHELPFNNSNWSKIKAVLIEKQTSQPIKTFKQLVETLFITYGKKFDISILLTSLDNEFWETKNLKGFNEYFYEKTLPFMIELILDSENLMKNFRLLKQQETSVLKITKKQACCILSCCFFGLFKKRPTYWDDWEKLPSLNFEYLFSGEGEDNDEYDELCFDSRMAKLRLILNYFVRVTKYFINKKIQNDKKVEKEKEKEEKEQIITFTRKVLQNNDFPKFENLKKPICNVNIEKSKSIFDMQKTIFVDFANRYIGGSVLSNGAVQEEILFVIAPELLTSRLFFECMEENEAIEISGYEIYSEVGGYSKSLFFKNDYIDMNKDKNGFSLHKCIAVDAKKFKKKKRYVQFQNKFINRELRKFFAGCTSVNDFNQILHKIDLPISTGKWGCGVFNGDVELKFIIQLLAISAVGGEMNFHCFGDLKSAENIQKLMKYLKSKNATVGKVYKALLDLIETEYRIKSTFKGIMKRIN